MDRAGALRLCEEWLPLWTGNRPERLVEVYFDRSALLDALA